MNNKKNYRKNFPITKNKIFLNHAATSPLSLPAQIEINSFLKRITNFGPVGDPSIYKSVFEAKRLAADLVGSQTKQIAFVNNTSSGLSIAAVGLCWEPGDNVVLNDLEFPSNVYPWLNLEKNGIETRIVSNSRGSVNPDDLFKAVDKKTKVIAISWVEFSTGFCNSLELIGEFCRRKDIVFVVDASQGLGALQINLSKQQIDVFVSCAHKWLIGPQGIGLLFLSERALEKIQPKIVGWHSVIDDEDYLNYDLTFKPDARRFEEGTLNISGIYGLKGSLEILLSVGMIEIESEIKKLTDYLVEQLKNKSYSVISSRKEGEWSGIISFNQKGIDGLKVVKELARKGIIISYREGLIRASPHFYNTKNELDEFISQLP